MILVLSYLLPVLLLVVLLLRCPLRQGVKTLLLLALPFFYVGHYLGLQQLAGWPSPDAPPEGFQLLGERIEQPDKSRGLEGRIELWVLPPGASRSRLHELPYSRTLHERLLQARQRRSEGHAQQGKRERSAAALPGAPEPAEGDAWRFEDAPRHRPPPKG